MTAIVGIINSQGMAIAADSTATSTIGSQTKTIETANKIFALSKYQPVSIMVYNSSVFMGIPWEVVIKSYRQNLAGVGYATLERYKESFFDFLRTIPLHWNYPKRMAKAYVSSFFDKLLYGKINTIYDPKKGVLDYFSCVEKITEEYAKKPKHSGEMLMINNLMPFHEDPILSECFSSVERFLKKTEPNFQMTDTHKMSMAQLFVGAANSNSFINHTGVVFAGFGEKELFASCIETHVDGEVAGKLRFTHIQTQSLENSRAVIVKFAQSIEANAVLHGIDISYKQFIVSETKKAFDSVKNKLWKLVKNDNQRLRQELDKVIREHEDAFYKTMNQHERKHHVEKIFAAIDPMQPYELAELAEALVKITYLKRKFSNEVNSVGGPIDVAVLTKGDGLIWIRRKHYFDADLNYGFFQRNQLK